MKKINRGKKSLALLAALFLLTGSLTVFADEPAGPNAASGETLVEEEPSGEGTSQTPGEGAAEDPAAGNTPAEGAAVESAHVSDPYGNWPVDVEKTDCSITLLLEYMEGEETKTLVGGSIAIYTLATVKVDNGYVFDVAGGKFADVEAVQAIPSMDSAALNEVNATLARSLEALAGDREADATVAIENGQVTFSNLTPGLYLLIQPELSEGERKMNPFLLSIPDANGDYEVTAKPKPGIYIPPTEPETPPETTPPEEIPQTGQEWWPVWLMAGAGVLLVLIGIFARIKEER